jgi:acetylornithine/N-succinyldiaminopimelate aminotransferase
MEGVFQKDEKFVFQTYKRQPIVLVEGKGAIVKDIDGREYIDCVAGIAVNNVGHCHPEVIEAIKEQAELLIHTSNLYYNERQVELAEELAKITSLDRIFFCNSGTEAMEAALKLARKYTGKKEFIAADGSFHGRTFGALSITHEESYRRPFEPLLQGMHFVPYDDVEAIRSNINDDTAAVVLEAIQGEGGINVPSDDYLPNIREICDEKGVLLILDEVQTGFGRTGRWFASFHSNIIPDIMTMAKALGGGFPIGAMAAKDDVSRAFEKGNHAATFGGDPLACSAAIASINVIKKEKLVERSEKMGEYLIKELENLDLNFVKDIRGKGLMIGIETRSSGERFVDEFREESILINCTAGNVIRLVPPLVIDKAQIDEVVYQFSKLD